MNQQPEPEWLSLRQYADKYKISVGTVRARLRKNQLPNAKKIHGMWRVLDPNHSMYLNGPTGDYSDIAILRSAEVARVMRCKPRTINEMANRGLLKYKEVLGIRHFPLSEVLRLIDLKEKYHQMRAKKPYQPNAKREMLIAWVLREIKERRPNSPEAKPL